MIVAESSSTQPSSTQRLRLWLRLLRATRRVEAELRERLRDAHDTTLPRFDVLAALHREPDGLMMSEVSKRLMVTNGNVTGLVDRLSDDGLVARAAIEGDRRATLVHLTDAGRATFEAMAPTHQEWIDEIFQGLSPVEVATMIAGLEKLLNDKQLNDKQLKDKESP